MSRNCFFTKKENERKPGFDTKKKKEEQKEEQKEKKKNKLMTVPTVSKEEIGYILYVLLLFFYSIICLVATMRIFRIWLFRHRFLSFQGAFLLLCVTWSSLRIIFWASTSKFLSSFSPLLPLFFYWAPDVLQFAMLSLITLYSYKILKIRWWQDVSWKI